MAALGGLILAALAAAQSGGTPPLTRLVPTHRPSHLVLRVGLETVVDLKATAVPLNHGFKSDDRFRITVKANRTGYLYLLDRGAAGKLERLWPLTGGAVPIAAHEAVLVPPDGSLRLDTAAGTETVQVVFALDPVSDPLAPLSQDEHGGGGRASTVSQIRLRGMTGDSDQERSDLASYFAGEIAEHGIAVVELSIAHHARR